MRITAIVVLVLGLATGACQRAGQSAGSGQPEGTTAQSAANGVAATPGTNGARPGDAAAAGTASNSLKGTDTAAREPQTREVTLESGTSLPVVLDTPVSSEGSQVGDEVRGHLSKPIMVDGETVLGTGTVVDGVVSAVERSGRVKGRAHLAFRFEGLTPDGGARRPVAASPYARTAEATKKKDAVKVGAPAAGGALIGAIAGGKKGALVGGAIGAGAGGAVVMSTRGDEVHLVRGTVVTVRLTEALRIDVPVR